MSVSEGFRVSTASAFNRPGRLSAQAADYRTASPPTRSTGEAYNDQARRLRQQCAADPERLHRGLCELSRRHDRAHPRIQTIPTPARVSAITVGEDWGSSRPEPKQDTASCVTRRIYAVPTPENPDSAFARAVVDWFADQVARQFSGQLLHQSQRRSLLKTADRLGIDRFHANLIIAVAQHDAATRSTRTRMYPTTRRFTLSTVTVLLVIQSLIVWGAWHVLH